MSKTPSAGKPLLQPAVLSFFKTRLDADEIARRVDNRPLAELESQVADAFRQILVRAHAGDDTPFFRISKRYAKRSCRLIIWSHMNRTG